MVAVVVEEGEAVLRGAAPRRLAVALLVLPLVDAPVLQREGTTEEVVRGVGALHLRECKLPRAAQGDADVRHRCLVHGAQLLTRCAVDVAGDAAVGELNADGVVQVVVVYPGNLAPGIAHQRPRPVVGEGVRLLPGVRIEIRGIGIRRMGRVIAHARQQVALFFHSSLGIGGNALQRQIFNGVGLRIQLSESACCHMSAE